ncbi:hypothetical protein TNCV_2684551 [Trichonephila clavipes]|nr:hypothetical protein TNCV_2684551 [Trichonephila clavipes]
MAKSKLEHLDHPPYSPDMSPCNLHVLGPLKKHLKGKRFNSDDELNDTVKDWIPSRQQELYDEAHFWLNGYVNKQNCRISSEANPQVYVETPLHPEKLTVWCALWAGGILLQKR